VKKQTRNQATIDQDTQRQIPYYSNGSELIPSEIKSDLQSNNNLLLTGYRKDDEGIINNYSVEPDMYPATKPTSKQQLRYVFLGGGAILFIFTLLLIAFAVS